MPVRHILSLDFPDTASPYVFRIHDTSIYTESLAVDCPRLDVTPPGADAPVYITDTDKIPGSGYWSVSAEDLGLQPSGQLDPAELPDGLYHFRYSVSPNEKVFVEYDILRVTSARNRLARLRCKVRANPCQDAEKMSKEQNLLRLIDLYLDAAADKVAVCHTPSEGLALWGHALKLMDKLCGPAVTFISTCGC